MKTLDTLTIRSGPSTYGGVPMRPTLADIVQATHPKITLGAPSDQIPAKKLHIDGEKEEKKAAYQDTTSSSA
jgi:hypothetical protein